MEGKLIDSFEQVGWICVFNDAGSFKCIFSVSLLLFFLCAFDIVWIVWFWYEKNVKCVYVWWFPGQTGCYVITAFKLK